MENLSNLLTGGDPVLIQHEVIITRSSAFNVAVVVIVALLLNFLLKSAVK